LEGAVVKVTRVPEQIGFWDAATKRLTNKTGCTVIVIGFEVAGLFIVHTVSEEVSVQIMTSPLSGG
jgi:hypothetical protein